jgi:NAD(P)-dependent dehydrogenase (short-subunit alcohol dehydrogenase family)
VVNNAGILRDVIFHKMTKADFESVINVHLVGAFNVSRAAAEHFRKQESGFLVHMSSTSGLIAMWPEKCSIGTPLERDRHV